MRRMVDGLFNRLRFNQKLFLSYLTVIIIPILMLGLYAFRQSEEMLRIQATQSIEKNLTAISQSLNGTLEQYDHTIRSVVYNKTFQRIVANDYIDLVNLSRDLNEYLTPYFNMMMTLNSDIKQVTFYTQSDVPEYGLSVQSHERVKDKSWYHKTIVGSGNQWSMNESGDLFVAGPFPRFFSDSDTNVLFMEINSDGLFKNITSLAKGYDVVIADRNGTLLYANSDAAASRAAEFTKVKDRPDSVIDASGERLYTVAKTIAQTGWTIRCFVPAKQMSLNADSILNATLIVIGSCIAFLLIIISIFSRTMIRRIYKLNALMRRVENGELSLQVQSASRDEIGELTNRFGNMIVRLNALVKEAYTNKIVQKEAELKALQSQINPHFLYNTLSFINWEAVKSEQHKISHVVTALSRFYRTSLNKGDNIIPVRDELDNIKSYLDIMLMMSDYEFDVYYDIDEEVYGYRMLNLILQPIAENAVKHGINQKKGGRGWLKISAKRMSQVIVFTVEDNGPGMDEETIRRLLLQQSSGYGLKNVNERLKLFFGADSGIGIESNPGRGTAMSVTIPLYNNAIKK
ncbi:sensor histidine kinase [Paenibacillus sp. FSL W7-1332]|uniref:sensor histidine kinase n=1 Tax=Paenibacillus sp. FSL W7-1332 TaxID=2921702 RepID=UPI0030CC7AFD